MRRRWTLRLVASLAAGAVVLSGCSEKQAASDTLPEADASPTASEPALPPLGPPDLPMPDEARTQDAAGAEAFVRYYFDVYNHAQSTLDATWVRELSAACDICEQLAAGLDADHTSGYVRMGGDITIAASSTPAISGGEAQTAFVLDQASLTVTKDGLPVAGLDSPARNGLTGGAILRWDMPRHTWIVSRVDVA